MNFKKNNIIKFNKGDYLVIDVLNYKNNTYLYLINNDEFKNDVSLVKVNEINDTINYSYIDDEDEFSYVLNKLFLNHKTEISDFID